MKDCYLIIDDFDKYCHNQLSIEYKAKWKHFLGNLRKNKVRLIVSVNDFNSLFESYITDFVETRRFIKQSGKYLRIYHNQMFSDDIKIYIIPVGKTKGILANKYYDKFNTSKRRNIHYF